MNIITYKLQERGTTGVKTVETFTDRDAGLAKLDKQIREHPVRYRAWTAFSLVLIQDGAK